MVWPEFSASGGAFCPLFPRRHGGRAGRGDHAPVAQCCRIKKHPEPCAAMMTHQKIKDQSQEPKVHGSPQKMRKVTGRKETLSWDNQEKKGCRRAAFSLGWRTWSTIFPRCPAEDSYWGHLFLGPRSTTVHWYHPWPTHTLNSWQ
jgi:hypothetical protein